MKSNQKPTKQKLHHSQQQNSCTSTKRQLRYNNYVTIKPQVNISTEIGLLKKHAVTNSDGVKFKLCFKFKNLNI